MANHTSTSKKKRKTKKGDLHIYPNIKEIRAQELELFSVVSTLARGKGNKRGIMYETKWKIDHYRKKIDFHEACLITRRNKEFLTPSEVPDRHQRAVRDLGSKLFDVRPFRGLQLYGPCDQKSLILATDGSEMRVFINMRDVTIWDLLTGSTKIKVKEVSPRAAIDSLGLKCTILQVIRLAHENSYNIKEEVLKNIEPFIFVESMTKRLNTLKKRGLGKEMLEYIWTTYFKQRELPAKVISLF